MLKAKVQWFQMAEIRQKNKFTQIYFTSFSVNLHNVRFRLPALHIQNLSNHCRHKYDPSISRDFPCKFLRFFTTSVSGCLCFTFKICQTVAGTSMIRRFHEFFESRFWRVFAILPMGNCAPPPPRSRHTCPCKTARTNTHHSLTYLPLSRADSDSLKGQLISENVLLLSSFCFGRFELEDIKRTLRN